MSRKRSAVRAYLMIFCLFFCLHPFSSFSQGKKIVVLGSSTAAANIWWSWVNQYGSYLASLNAGHSITNLAKGGFGTWSLMPTGSGLGEDPTRNITMALSLNPDIIIINLPTNDAAGGTPLPTTMARFRLFREMANAAGVSFWITTSQGRGTGPSAILVDTRDSINAQFGARAIDFFTTVANPNGSLNAAYDDGDNIHVNQAGHTLFFQRVMNKPILGSSVLPIVFSSFRVRSVGLTNHVSWEVKTSPEKFKQEIQRSNDGVTFYKIGELPESESGNFVFSDGHPLQHSNYYRIKLTTPTTIKYSNVLSISATAIVPKITVVPNPIVGRTIQLQIKSVLNEKSVLVVYNAAGAQVLREAVRLTEGASLVSYTLPSNIARGMYFLEVNSNSHKYVKQFVVE